MRVLKILKYTDKLPSQRFWRELISLVSCQMRLHIHLKQGYEQEVSQKYLWVGVYGMFAASPNLGPDLDNINLHSLIK